MRVLVVGPLPRLWAPNHLPWLRYTTSALRRLGHTVATAAYRESRAASPALASRLSGLPGTPGVLKKYVVAMSARRDRQAIAAARRFRPELTIVLKGEVYPQEVWSEIKRHTAGPMVTWWVDDPFTYPNVVRQFTVFDRVFVFDRSYVSDLASHGVSRTTFLPCACDETVYRPIALGAGERRRLASDVAFVASFYPQRGTLVRTLAATMNVGLWGHGWDRPDARLELGGAVSVRGGVIGDATAVKIYNAATIGLNAHHPQTRLGGVNSRTFELLASGTPPLVDRIAGIEELLEPDREVACYGSIDEARDVATRLAQDPAYRADIVRRGRERTLREHTYIARMRTLCQTAFQ